MMCVSDVQVIHHTLRVLQHLLFSYVNSKQAISNLRRRDSSILVLLLLFPNFSMFCHKHVDVKRLLYTEPTVVGQDLAAITLL